MRKKLWLVVSCLLALLMVLSACGGGTNSNNNQPAGNSQAPGSSQPSGSSQPPASTQPSGNNQSADNNQSAPPSAAADKKVTISWGTQLSPVAQRGVSIQKFIDTLTDKTGGSVEVNMYWSGSLFEAATGWEEVMAGTADVATISAGTALDHFVLEPAASLFIASAPLTFDNACKLMQELYYMTPGLQEEWAGLVPMAWDSAGGELYIMSTSPIRSLDDFKGKNFRYVGDYVGDMVRAFGATGVRMPLSEAPDALAKGIIDGSIQAVYNMRDLNYIDSCKYATGLGILTTVGLQTFIREDKFEEMSPAQKQAFMESIEFYQEEIWNVAAVAEEESIQFCWDNGAEIIRLTDAEYKLIQETIDSFTVTEVEKLNGLSYDGDQFYNDVQMLLDKYTK